MGTDPTSPRQRGGRTGRVRQTQPFNWKERDAQREPGLASSARTRAPPRQVLADYGGWLRARHALLYCRYCWCYTMATKRLQKMLKRENGVVIQSWIFSIYNLRYLLITSKRLVLPLRLDHRVYSYTTKSVSTSPFPLPLPIRTGTYKYYTLR